MSHMTLDETIAALQTLKKSGVDGSTPVAFPGVDNNGRGGWMQRVEMPYVTTVAKSDIDKQHLLCKVVSRSGVQIVVIG